MTSMKKKILSDAEVDGSVSINGDLTLTQISNGILVTDQNGTVSADSSIDFNELHALDGYDISGGTIENRLTTLDGKIDQEIIDRAADVDAEEGRAKAAEQAIDQSAVHIAGAETITGSKTFTSKIMGTNGAVIMGNVIIGDTTDAVNDSLTVNGSFASPKITDNGSNVVVSSSLSVSGIISQTDATKTATLQDTTLKSLNVKGDTTLSAKTGNKILATDANKKIVETIGTEHQVLTAGVNGPEWQSPSGPDEDGQGVASTGALYSEVARATGAESGLSSSIAAINGKISENASSSNKLMDKGYIDDADALVRNYVDDGLATKQPTITGGASSITSSNLATGRALVSDSNGKVAVSDITSTELSYLDDVTSNVQIQIDGKAPTNHAGQDTQQNPYPYGKASAQAYGHVQFEESISGNRTDVAVSEKGIKDFVNSSIGTATANFLGTYKALADTSSPDTSLGFTQTEVDAMVDPYSPASGAIVTALAGKISNPSPNDYCFVEMDFTTPATSPDEYRRYKFDGTDWAYEYTLNNSSYTQAQWDAIDSGITAAKVTTYDSHVSNTNNPHQVTKAQVGLGNADNTSDLNKPISTATQTALDGKADTDLQNLSGIGGTKADGKTIVWNSTDSQWDYGEAGKVDEVQINGTNIVSNKIANIAVVNNAPTLAWATQSQVGSVGGTALQVTMPSDPVTKANIETALNVSATYNDLALIVNNGVLDFGEAGKVDDVRINGNLPANSIVSNKIAVIPITVTDVHITEID